MEVVEVVSVPEGSGALAVAGVTEPRTSTHNRIDMQRWDRRILDISFATASGRLCLLRELIVVFVMFVAFALARPWWRPLVLAMAWGDLVIARGHAAEGRWHVLHCDKCPGPTVGWRKEPRSFMEDIIFPAVEEIVVGHVRGIKDLRPWDHDELRWGGNHHRWGRRWRCPNIDANIDLRCYHRWRY